MKWIPLLFLFACGGGHDPAPVNTELPHVTTEVSDITSTSAIISVKITDDGGLGIIERGIVINDVLINIDDSKKVILDPLESYTVKAFARNAKGVGYGQKVDFVANCESAMGGAVHYSTVPIASASSIVPCEPLVQGDVNFLEVSEGTYKISDISFGMYGCAWGDNPAIGVYMVDVCGTIHLDGSDQYSSSYSWVIMSNTGTKLVISWANDLGDSGITTLTGNWKQNLHL